MLDKYNISSRERKIGRNIKFRNTSYITTKNLDDTKEIIKWHKKNNAKKGGKSRHII